MSWTYFVDHLKNDIGPSIASGASVAGAGVCCALGSCVAVFSSPMMPALLEDHVLLSLAASQNPSGFIGFVREKESVLGRCSAPT